MLVSLQLPAASPSWAPDACSFLSSLLQFPVAPFVSLSFRLRLPPAVKLPFCLFRRAATGSFSLSSSVAISLPVPSPLPSSLSSRRLSLFELRLPLPTSRRAPSTVELSAASASQFCLPPPSLPLSSRTADGQHQLPPSSSRSFSLSLS